MLVRIQGKVTEVENIGGTSKAGRPWSKNIYTISDDFKNPEYNKCVKVGDLARLDPNKIDPEFIFKCNHVVGDTVDIVCYIETNEYGYTNLDYRCEFDDEENTLKSSGNVVHPKAEEKAKAEEAPVAVQSEAQTDLPF